MTDVRMHSQSHDHPCTCACIQSHVLLSSCNLLESYPSTHENQAQQVQYMLADDLDRCLKSDLATQPTLTQHDACSLAYMPYPHNQHRKSM